MIINDLIKKYQHNSENGSFFLNKNESINKVVTKYKVPNSYGVYVIYSVLNNIEEIIYIGKSGTMNNDGSFKKQGIKQRLTKKQDGIARREFFQNIILDKRFDKLKFSWITTFDKNNKVIPMYCEADLIQTYYNDFKKLPLLNKSV